MISQQELIAALRALLVPAAEGKPEVYERNYSLSAGVVHREKFPNATGLAVTSASSDVTLTVNGQTLTLSDGEAYDLPFDRIEISTAIDSTVQIKIGINGAPLNYNQNKANLTGSVLVSAISAAVAIDDSTPLKVHEQGGDNFVGIADPSVGIATSAQIVPARATKREVVLVNPASNPATAIFRIGGVGTVGAAQGIPLPAGASTTIATKAAIWAYNPDSSARSLTAVEIY
jgi:hypothetical protein